MARRMETPVQYLKGVGAQRAALFSRLGIHTIGELLRYYPRDYLDLSHITLLAEAPFDSTCTVCARIVRKGREQRIRARLSIFKLQIADDSGIAEVMIFNNRYLVDALKPDGEYLFYGKVGGSFTRRELSSPMILPFPAPHAILPIYPLTAGLTTNLIQRCVEQSLKLAEEIPSLVPPEQEGEYWMDSTEAFRAIHFPDDLAQANRARLHFAFEELLTLCCSLSLVRSDSIALQRPALSPVDLAPFYASLPFSPTAAQRRCIAQAVEDMCSTAPMNRLIQGDVGSGKTLVAAACVYFVCQNGKQAAVMAPTELLAEQHFHTFSQFLAPFGINVALLTSSTRAAQRRHILQGLSDGSIHLAVGTHALLNETVTFAHLDLAITDEQHRFGVAQRARLAEKNECAHLLVMSATPIPRTLSLIIYGDLALSVIDELPAGRQPVQTLVIDSAKRKRAFGFIRDALDAGRQAYLVCPLIEQDEETPTDLKPAADYKAQLEQGEFRGYRVGLLHGKMKPKEKEAVMRGFQSGEIQLLVSTTVVEVGIDVPNATIMLIENAERFGLSQLHQLRGRIGRGEHQSWCILVTDSKGDATRERMRMMKETCDGFKIADADLKLRGPGDFFGQRQHGLPELRVASLTGDVRLMEQAKACAENILAQDPSLALPQNAALRQAVMAMIRQTGQHPN